MRLGESLLVLIIVLFSGFIVLDISGYIPWTLISPWGNAVPPAGIYWNFLAPMIMFVVIGVGVWVFYLIMHRSGA